MSCRKVCRELIDRIRFGDELDARSAPHLAHLDECPACREEVGLNRTIVRQMRRVLQARVEGHEPSAESWTIVSQRALALEAAPGLGGRIAGLLRRPASMGMAIRASALALAVVLAVFVNAGPDGILARTRPAALSMTRQARPMLATAWADPADAPHRHTLQPVPPQVHVPTTAVDAEVDPVSVATPIPSGLIE